MLLTSTQENRSSVFASDRRSSERIDVTLWTRISLSDDSEYPARVTNISPSGMMAMTPCGAHEDVTVRVKIVEIGWVDGIIAWRMNDRIGIIFDHVLSDQDFTALAPYCI
jgi:c-di-GMP-binding flagellar brake protein YcgR